MYYGVGGGMKIIETGEGTKHTVGIQYGPGCVRMGLQDWVCSLKKRKEGAPA